MISSALEDIRHQSGTKADDALAFLVGYMKQFGVLGNGIGSQVYIGQLLAYSAQLTSADRPMGAIAGLIAALGRDHPSSA
jgi:hypothetical protein